MNLRRIGISGLMGAGKTTCAGLFASELQTAEGTVRLVDGDAEAKMIMRGNKEIQKKLTASFGKAVISDGEIDFSSLGSRAFAARSQLLILNKIVHPLLLERLRELIFSTDNGYVICDAALISLWHIEEWFDMLVWVRSSFEKRQERLIKKVKGPSDQLTMRMLLQQEMIPEPKQDPWKTIENQGTIEEMRPQVVSLCMMAKNGRSLSMKDGN
jgi:dephospho-CoA kinase